MNVGCLLMIFIRCNNRLKISLFIFSTGEDVCLDLGMANIIVVEVIFISKGYCKAILLRLAIWATTCTMICIILGPIILIVLFLSL